MALELHVYVRERMPSSGMTEYWRVQQAIKWRKSRIDTNQLGFVNAKTCDAGYSIYVHEDGTTTVLTPQTVDEIGKFLRMRRQTWD